MISPQHRRRLNRAMHELRRPLQALASRRRTRFAGRPGPARPGAACWNSPAAPGCSSTARSTVPARRPPRGGSPAGSCCASLERWRAAADAAGESSSHWDAGPAVVVLRSRADVAGARQPARKRPRARRAAAGRHRGSRRGRLRITVANGAGGGLNDAGRSGSENGVDARDPRRGQGSSWSRPWPRTTAAASRSATPARAALRRWSCR